MKVYRIKHKPSGRYYEVCMHKLTEFGTVIYLKPDADIALMLAKCDYREKYHPSEFEIKECNLED